MVRHTKPPLSQMLVCQAFPVVAQCTLRTDDNTTMQVRQGAPSTAVSWEFVLECVMGGDCYRITNSIMESYS